MERVQYSELVAEVQYSELDCRVGSIQQIGLQRFSSAYWLQRRIQYSEFRK